MTLVDPGELLAVCATYTPQDVVDSVLSRLKTQGNLGLYLRPGALRCVYGAGRQIETWCAANDVLCVPWTTAARRLAALTWVGDLEDDIVPRIGGAVVFDCRLDKEARLMTALLATQPSAPPILRVVTGSGVYWEELLLSGDVGLGLRAGV